MSAAEGSGAGGSAGGRKGVAVCFDRESAARVVSQGGMVVLCGRDGEALVTIAAALAPAGRIGLLVGDAADDQVQASARAMARELFGQEPVVLPLRPTS